MTDDICSDYKIHISFCMMKSVYPTVKVIGLLPVTCSCSVILLLDNL
ncbi:19413_t:CDS:2 [Cetraspora pellucida]|uniref:19413_t:CDS:1 n=1 Tax=Cetraspora pellucida TaxID=1433469 RepID=A0A9N9CTH6_9GLOM|nr:19413_t:CDS:2 [Cetraspora pellucida]